MNDAIIIRMGCTLAQAEQAVVVETWEHCRRHVHSTATMLGMTESFVYKRLRSYGIIIEPRMKRKGLWNDNSPPTAIVTGARVVMGSSASGSK